MSDLPWNEIGLRCEPDHVAPLVAALPKDEVVLRLKEFAAWTTEVGTARGVHVVITPVLAEFLAQASRIGELDELVEQTRNGQFDPDNAVQRDLEYGRFQIEYRRFQSSRPADEDAYTLFTELDRLPLSREREWEPSEEDLLSVKRAAYEAVGFARFLDEFRRRTSRPVIVLGNDKGQLLGGGYGRLWSPEPGESALIGEILLPWPSPPAPDPQIVHANPIIYRSNRNAGGRQVGPAHDLPAYVGQTTPYYLDSVDKRLRVESFIDGVPRLATWGEVNDNPEGPAGCLNPTHTLFGFGPHGFERRAVGPSLARCVGVIQSHIKAEIDRLI